MARIIVSTDTFQANTSSTTGILYGEYLWSNPNNWSAGVVPSGGDTVILDAYGVDDIGSLSLASVTEIGATDLHVAGSSLAIGTLDTTPASELYAGFLGVSTPVTVSVSTVVGSGSILGAVGGTFIDLSSSDPGELYFAGYGGAVTLHAAPVSTTTLEFGGGYADTLALEALPTGVYSAALEGLAVGDVLELPGSAVEGMSFGASSVTITTDLGTTTFANASYGNSVTGYIATHNNANGLEAVTLTGPDIFSDGLAAGSGAGVLDGQYLWSNPDNWSFGTTPVSGGSVVLDGYGVDDIGSLSLASVTEIGGTDLHVAGSSLAIGTLDTAPNAELYAGILGVSTPVTVSVSAVVGAGSILGAVGGTFIDLSASDPGELYFAGYGGAVTLHAAPASSSILEFGGGYVDTLALEALPTGVYSAALEGLAVGDVLELPGSAVEGVSFGASSLTITTNLGTTTFANAGYENSVTGYIATHDNANGLEAVTLTGPDIFTGGYLSTIGSIGVIQLWSTAYNWESGTTPVSGGSVVLDADGVDNLGSISLTSITEEPGAELFYISGASLAVGTLAVNANDELYAGILGDATPVTVSVSAVVGSGSILGAVGGTFIDLSSSDPGELYFAGYGGEVTLHAAPVSTTTLEFGGGYADTLALETLPTGVYSAALEGLAVGDVLELPGSAVEGMSFGASSVTITTDLGTTTFANASYGNSVTGYIATHNNANGLEAVTLTGPDIFTGGYLSTIGSIGVIQLWSTAYNWESGTTPVSGGSVVLDADGVDNLGSISLTSITEEPGAELFYISGASLAVGTLAVNANDELYAGILGDATPVTVSVSAVVGAGSILGAVGGTFIDLSASDPGELYFAGYGGAVTLHAAPASSSILEFGGGYVDTLALEALPTGVYSAELEGLAVGDVLELPGSAVEGVSFGASSLAITTSAGIFDFSDVHYAQPINGETATYDTASGLEAITFTEVTCYASGTRILTSHGEFAVELLQIGDLLKTLHSGYQKIKWIGTRSYDGRFIQGNKAALPICIKQNAIADNIPARDLFVSPGHAICFEGALVHAARLVNGVSVVQAERVDRVTYYHIEMENHEIIFAENCPAETFMREDFRPRFQNAAEFARLYPGEAATEIACLPRLDSGFQLHAIQRRIAGRAGIAVPDMAGRGPLRGYVDQAGPDFCYGWAQEVLAPEEPVCLDITENGRRIGRVLANLYRADLHAAGYGSGCHGFEFILPAGRTGRIEAVRTSDRTRLARAANAAAQAA